MVLKINKSASSEKKTNIFKKINELANLAGYNIIQTNGQRVFAPPPSLNISSPLKGSEVFIGKLTKNIFEDELIPLFGSIGPLYKFRMMLDFEEKSRGYAFAQYFDPKDAERAVKNLDNYEIRPKLFIGVYKSVDNCRLFIGNVPLDKNRQDVFSELQRFAEGIIDVIIFKNAQNPHLNRGFVFVEFESHRYAAMARRQFTPNNLILWGQTLYVDWADPVPNVEPHIMAKVTILYLSNLPLDYTSDDVIACICKVMSSRMIKKVHKHLTYAFVHFNNRSSAEYAFAKLQGFYINRSKVEVEWARPRRYSKKYRSVNPPDNFCTSVPPSVRRLVYQKKNKKYNSVSSTGTFSNITSNIWESCGSKKASSSSESTLTAAIDTYFEDSEYSSFYGV